MDSGARKADQASHKLAEQMYKAAAAQRPRAGASPSGTAGCDTGRRSSPKKDEGVIDAEYVDVDDKKVSCGLSVRQLDQFAGCGFSL